jgi:hypothetical protein
MGMVALDNIDAVLNGRSAPRSPRSHVRFELVTQTDGNGKSARGSFALVFAAWRTPAEGLNFLLRSPALSVGKPPSIPCRPSRMASEI